MSRYFARCSKLVSSSSIGKQVIAKKKNVVRDKNLHRLLSTADSRQSCNSKFRIPTRVVCHCEITQRILMLLRIVLLAHKIETNKHPSQMPDKTGTIKKLVHPNVFIHSHHLVSSIFLSSERLARFINVTAIKLELFSSDLNSFGWIQNNRCITRWRKWPKKKKTVFLWQHISNRACIAYGD